MALLLCAGSLVSCSTLKALFKSPEEKVVMAFHELHEQRSGATLPYPVQIAPGRQVYLSKRSLLTSKEMAQIIPFQVEGGYGLRCLLTNHGAMLWQQSMVSARAQEDLLALVTDKGFRTLVQVQDQASDRELLLSGPFTWGEAKYLAAKGEN